MPFPATKHLRIDFEKQTTNTILLKSRSTLVDHFLMHLLRFINLSIFETFAREYGKIKNSVISPIFLKNEINSRALERIFKENRGNSSIFNSSYSRAKVSLINSDQVLILDQIFDALERNQSLCVIFD